MSALSINPPFPVFPDLDGQPLEDGYIWIGVAGLNPITNPIVVYWDAALTIPAGLPVRTIGGFPSRAGTPARLYAGSDYSIQVQNKNGSIVYSSPNDTNAYIINSADVTFIQAGAGAVQRTAQSKMRDVVSVKDFGAVGNGIADDTIAIQAAFDALASNGSLYFPPGHYMVSNSISTATDEITVYGEYATIQQTGSFKKTFNFTNANQISVSGLKFVGLGTEYNGASSAYNGVAAIFFNNGINCKVSNCQIERHSGGGIRYTDIDGLIISNCTIIGIGTAGGIVSGGNNGDAAIGVANAPTGDANVVIIGCTIKDHCFGVLASRRSGLVVDGCIIGPIPGQHGVYAAAKSGMTVTGCLFQDIANEAVKNQIAATSDIATNDCTIVGNTFRVIGQSCVVIAPAVGATIGRFINITVSSNTAKDIGNYFSVIRKCDGAEVVANSIYDCGSHPIELQDFHGRIVSNYIKDASWSAIYLQANGPCEISDNTFEDVCLNTEGSGTANIRYQVMVYARDESGSGTGHQIIMKQNTYRMTVSPLPTQLVRCFRSNANVDVYLHQMHNETGLAMQIDSLKSQDIGYSPNVDNVVSATLNPTTPLYGRGRRELFGTQDPASAGMTDTFREGDICWNATPAAGGTPGWMCVVDGAPGTWKAMANLAV